MLFSRNNLIQIFNGSLILAFTAFAIMVISLYEFLNGNKESAEYLYKIGLLPAVVAMCGLIFFIIKIKKVDYNKDKS